MKKCTKVCGNPYCSVSTGIHEGLTFGSGELDFNGFWAKPCAPCARAWEKAHPEDAPCWPFAEHDDVDTHAATVKPIPKLDDTTIDDTSPGEVPPGDAV